MQSALIGDFAGLIGPFPAIQLLHLHRACHDAVTFRVLHLRYDQKMPPKPAAPNAGARIVKLDATQTLNKPAAKPKKAAKQDKNGSKGGSSSAKKRKAGHAQGDADSDGSESDAVRLVVPHAAAQNLLTRLNRTL